MHKEEQSTGETNEGRKLNHSGGEEDRKCEVTWDTQEKSYKIKREKEKIRNSKP